MGHGVIFEYMYIICNYWIRRVVLSITSNTDHFFSENPLYSETYDYGGPNVGSKNGDDCTENIQMDNNRMTCSPLYIFHIIPSSFYPHIPAP